jgi:hypothetical protein
VGSTAGRKQLNLGPAVKLTGKAAGLPKDPSHRRVSGKSPFAGASFEATLNEVKLMPSGEMRVVFIVPDSDSDEGIKLRHAYACSIRVTVERLSHAKK